MELEANRCISPGRTGYRLTASRSRSGGHNHVELSGQEKVNSVKDREEVSR